mmetsp:Transcript_20568/g.78861  ORF Transcript_20568/g.78861 Transcript_20568/m.78861 type:complete len:226 (+) Transcript_20568:27-704(+)
MAPIKFTYFPLRARGFVSRALLVVSGAEWVDDRVSPEAWAEKKGTTPFGQVPLLEDEDVGVLAQSDAINRHLARKFGLAGKGIKEQALVDQAYEEANDLLNQVIKTLFSGATEEGKATLLTTTIPKHVGHIKTLLEANGNNGFLVGDSLTVADIQAFHVLNNWARPWGPEAVAPLQSYLDGVRKANAALSKWISEGSLCPTTAPGWVPIVKFLNKPEQFEGEFAN